MMGFGAGLLATVYDNIDTFKVNAGAAYQSKLDFEFQVDESLFPVWDWPQMVNAGITLYLLQGQPLRVTLDAQFLGWAEAIAPSENPGRDSFRDSLNFSAGAEYKIPVGERWWLLPRAGYRHLQSPWEDKDLLPAAGTANLLIDTEGGDYSMVTAGAGLRWQTEGGQTRGLDVGIDVGVDSYNVAFGYVHEF
jgi:long-subunit fatty acid transport protein